jgi:Family of unknown function (DUF6328)
VTDQNETQDERENRELIEMLNEVRVVLPGVQVLFAFLLTLAFSSTFATIDAAERFTYLVAFFSTAGASILLMTPTTFHRIRFRQGDKEALLRMATRFILAGMVLLSIAMVSGIWLVSEKVMSQRSANVVGVVAIVAIVVLWFGIPIWRRARKKPSVDR